MKQHDNHVRDYYLRRVGDVYLDEGMRGWIARTARKEYWRVASSYELSDLIQDGYLCYAKCRNAYALAAPAPGHTALNTDTPTPLQRSHFASLVKTAFVNHIMTLSSRNAARHESVMSELLGDDSPGTLEKLLPSQPEEASLLVLLAQAPTEIKEVIEKLVQDGAEAGSFLRSRLFQDQGRLRRGRTQIRETTKERWKRILGDAELPDRVVAYLQS